MDVRKIFLIAVTISILITVGVIYFIFNRETDDDRYKKAEKKIMEIYKLNNEGKEISLNNVKLSEYGKYKALIDLEMVYLKKEKEKDVKLADAMSSVMNMQIRDYSESEIKKFKEYVKNAKLILDDEDKDYFTRADEYLKSIKHLDIAEKNRSKFFTLANSRIEKEKVYYTEYYKLLKEFVGKADELGNHFELIQKNKTNKKYDIKKEFDKAKTLEDELGKIKDNIVEKTKEYSRLTNDPKGQCCKGIVVFG